jgi:hypothetical protein
MTINQILYKISNLRYSIRKKEVEQMKAVNTGDQHNMNLNNADLALLKADLVVTVKAFNSIPVNGPNNRMKSLLAKLFQFGKAFNKRKA